MTATAGMMLVNEIVPLIISAIYRGAVKPIGTEDKSDLVSEATAIAANNLESCESRRKEVSPNSLAFYAVQTLKTGRRACGGSRHDVMSPAATLAGVAQLRSMDQSLGIDEVDPTHEVTLHDFIASSAEDTDVVAARELDWESVLAGMDDRRACVLRETAAGYGPNEIAEHIGVSAPRVIQLRQNCGRMIKEAWGGDGVADVATAPKYRARMRAVAERRTGRAERAWSP